MSLRELKKKKTRDQLIRIATTLFLERGFEGTTVDDIVARAEVSQRTFFRYFPTKEAVVFRHHEERITMFRELLDEEKDSTPPFEAVLGAVIRLAKEYMAKRDELFTEVQIVSKSPVLVGRDVELDHQFETAITQRLCDPDSLDPLPTEDAPIFAGAIFGAVRAIMGEWYEAGGTEDLVEFGKDRMGRLAKSWSLEWAPNGK